MNLYDILKQKTKKQAPNGALPNNVEENWINDLPTDQLKALGGNGPWEQLQVGDPVIISGKGINFEGATGEVAEVGREGKFLVVNLYNHGKHSFHSSDVSYNDYADSDEEEARMYDAGELRNEVDEGADDRKQNALWAQITAHEKAAKKSKDLKQQHHLKMANQLRGQLKTSDNEQGVAEGLPKNDKDEFKRQALLVKDRKTGKLYDPNKEFDKKMKSPEVMAQMKRMAAKEGVVEGQLNEYFVKAGMPVKDVLALNLFQDFDPVEGAAAQFAEFAQDPMWQQVVRKYAPIANMLKKKLLATKRPLTDAEAEAVDQTWYDGSDAYDDMEIEYLIDIYDQQIDTLEALLAGNLTDEEFMEQGVAEGYEPPTSAKGSAAYRASLLRKKQERKAAADAKKKEQGVAEGFSDMMAKERKKRLAAAEKKKQERRANTGDPAPQHYRDELAQAAKKYKKGVAEEESQPTKYRATVEYGPTAADAHFVTVTANSTEEAEAKVAAWCKKKGVRNPMITINGADKPVAEHIVKVGSQYELKSKHGNKNLGKYPTRAGAEQRERQVQYFKHANEGVTEGANVAQPGQRVTIITPPSMIDVLPGDTYEVRTSDAEGVTLNHGLGTRYDNVKFPHGTYKIAKEQGVAEASPETTLNLLKGLKTWQVVIMNNYYRGKYSDYSGRYYYVLASSPEEAKQVVLDNADAILQELLAMKSHNGKKILPRGTAVRITPERINGVKDGTEAGRMSTAGFKKMFGPQGPMMVKLSSGAIVDVQDPVVQGSDLKTIAKADLGQNKLNLPSGYGDVVQPQKLEGVAEGVAETVSMNDAMKVLRHYGAGHFKTTSNELHFYKNGQPFSVDLTLGADSIRTVSLSQLNHAARQLKGQGVKELDEVSRGDYHKKATMGKAMAQMSAGFARSPEEREKFNQIAGRRERGLERSKARTDKFRADKAAKDEAGRLEQLRTKYAGVDIDAEIAKLKPAIDSAYHEYQYGARNTYSQGRDDYNSLLGRVQELERAKKALASNPPLSELSNKLLGDYKKAAGISARDLDKAGKYKQADKRFHGIVQATKKELDNDMKKHQQDEITESRLASMKRAGYDIK